MLKTANGLKACTILIGVAIDPVNHACPVQVEGQVPSNWPFPLIAHGK
ncbi:MAG: hypothetical protein GTN74_01150 [Proteobacteria bacterium]|nr:hypothetical protein [Pseudomonadota bacterium]NIS67646.1 hypothetical protein [Pseudomonadota bacterium]